MLFGTACGSAPDGAACRSRAPSIADGVFGCVTSTGDVGDTSTHALPDFEVQAFAAKPSGDSNDGAVPEATSTSDADGFYEMRLAAGHHWICTSFRRCTERDLATGTRRLDYSFSVGPGWSE
jgi:hypothetical protein